MSTVSSRASLLHNIADILDLDGLSDFESTVPEDLLDAYHHSEYITTAQTRHVQEQASATSNDITPEIIMPTRTMSIIDKVVDQEAFPVHQIIPQVRMPPVTIFRIRSF
jgi:hypothetical protein